MVIPIGRWFHFALVRNTSNITSAFLDGVQLTHDSTQGQNNFAGTIPFTTLGIFDYSASPYQAFNGYISNFRVVNGTALYSANFTPSTSPLPAITNTAFLSCVENRFKDNSLNNYNITPYGNVQVDTFSPFSNSTDYSPGAHGGSGFFPGNGAYLELNSVLSLAGNFTVEAWIYTKDTSNGMILASSSSSTSPNHQILRVYSGKLLFSDYNASFTVTGGTIYNNQWTHVAVVRSSTTVNLYINGKNVVSASGSANTLSVKVIGAIRFQNSMVDIYTGYISNMRVTNSVLYNADFNGGVRNLV